MKYHVLTQKPRTTTRGMDWFVICTHEGCDYSENVSNGVTRDGVKTYEVAHNLQRMMET